MENKLSRLFDYQKFSGNDALADIINDVESRYPSAKELSDDDLFFVNAARGLDTEAAKRTFARVDHTDAYTRK